MFKKGDLVVVRGYASGTSLWEGEECTFESIVGDTCAVMTRCGLAGFDRKCLHLVVEEPEDWML